MYYIVKAKEHQKYISYEVYQREYRPEIWRSLKKIRHHAYYVGSYPAHKIDSIPDETIKQAVYNYIARHAKKEDDNDK